MSPSGVVHHRWWKRLLLIVAVVLATTMPYVSRWDLLIVVFIGYLLGYFIDPDLDQVSITSAEGRMLKLGLVGSLLVAYWFPYSVMFQHRSFLSHFPFVSTFIRLVYGFWWIPCLVYYYDPNFMSLAGFYSLGIWIGLSIADGVHYILDEAY